MSDNRFKTDVREIVFRTFDNEYTIPLFRMTREDALQIKEIIFNQHNVIFCTVYLIGGNTI